MQWAAEGELGAYLADPISAGEWKYKIPKKYMAPHFGKVITVIYLFNDKLGEPHHSDPFTLNVLGYPRTDYRRPKARMVLL
ncbi:hypothetical protein CES87_04295 [Pseudomonas sp. ERMR1:02]|nr:hypothetical protein CES87_04295 [Pseudomonas sp. ERMR1:02]